MHTEALSSNQPVEAFWGARKPDTLVIATSSVRKTAMVELLRLFEQNREIPSQFSVAEVPFTVDEEHLKIFQQEIFAVRNGDGELTAPLFLGELDGVEVWVQPSDGETDSNEAAQEAVNKARAVLPLLETQQRYAGKKIWVVATDIVGSSSLWDHHVLAHDPEARVPFPLGKPVNGAKRGEFDADFAVTDPTDPVFRTEYVRNILAPGTELLHSSGVVIIDEHGEEHVCQLDLPHAVIPEDIAELSVNLEAGLAGAPNDLVLAHAFPAALELAGRGDGHDQLLALAHINGWPHRMVQTLAREVAQLQLLSVQLQLSRQGSDTTGVLREGMPLVSPQQMRALMWTEFLQDRPAVRAMDSNIHGIIGAIIGEADEAEEEYGHNGTYSPELHRKELVDILFFIESFAITVGVELDYDRILSLFGKVDTGSQIYDTVREIAGNIPVAGDVAQPQLARDLEYAYALVFKHMYELREIQSPLVVLTQVLQKNVRNYPAEYFNGIDEKTGNALTFPELIKQYIHAVRAMRMIRTASGNNPKGLEPHHHKPFADSIRGWKTTEGSLAQLESSLQSAQFVPGKPVVLYSAS